MLIPEENHPRVTVARKPLEIVLTQLLVRLLYVSTFWKKDHSSSYTVQTDQWTLYILFIVHLRTQNIWFFDAAMVTLVSSQYFHTTSLPELANCSFCLTDIFYYQFTLFYHLNILTSWLHYINWKILSLDSKYHRKKLYWKSWFTFLRTFCH